MKTTALFAFLASAVPLYATVFTVTVTGDTYFRNDGGTGPTTQQNDDTDNEMLVGSNGATNNLRGLMRFDVASIVNDVNTIGGGNFANLTVNSASLQVFERRGRANTVNVIVNDYNFAFDPATATWTAPAAGDSAAGGTVGSPLGSQSITWDATADNQSATIPLTPATLKTSLQNHLSNSLHFILTTNTPTQNFLSIRSDRDAAQSARFARLTIDYTVAPAGGPTFEIDPATPAPDFAFPVSNVSASPLTRTMRFKNTSASQSVTVNSVGLTGSGVFTVGSVNPPVGSVLAAGQSIDVQITASSATSGTFTGSLLVDVDASGQDQTLPVAASFFANGELRNPNPGFVTTLTDWAGGSTRVEPGLMVPSGDGMVRVRGNGDPVTTKSSLSQSTVVPNGLPEWTLDFRFTPVAPAAFEDYTGNPASGEFADRAFQLVVQGSDVVPAAADFNDTTDDATLINLAYMPDGIAAGGIPGFYLYDGQLGTWVLVDFNGDGSGLVLAGSTDVDTDADPLNGIGDGILDVASGDTVNVYRLTLRGRGFGAAGASYDLTLNGPGAGFPKTVTGLTSAHSVAIDTGTPAAFAFVTSDTSSQSNATAGLCPSFWVDEVGYFSADRPARRLLFFNPPAVLRSLNGANASHTLIAVNDGTSAAVQLGGSVIGSPAVSLTTTLPVSIAAGQTTTLGLSFDPSQLSAPDTAAVASLNPTSDDPALPSASFAISARKVSDANLLANGDFETDSAAGVFPLGWNVTGAPSEEASFVAGGGSAVALAPGQGILQDLFPAGVAPLPDFQAAFAIRFSQENQAHRIRFEGNNGDDLVTLRLTANTAAADSIDAFASGIWTSALSGLSLDPGTTYFLRVTGRDFGLPTRRFTVALSTDGVNYSVSPDLTAFHASPNVAFETVTFECGATADSLLRVDGVAVTVPPLDDFASWMSGFTFAPGANLSADGDADGDGIANIVENVLGTAPNAPSTGLTAVSGSAGALSFSHPLNPEISSDVNYNYQWSTDLAEWQASGEANTGGTVITIAAGAPVSGVVQASATVSSGSAPRVFVRLSAVLAAP